MVMLPRIVYICDQPCNSIFFSHFHYQLHHDSRRGFGGFGVGVLRVDGLNGKINLMLYYRAACPLQ